MKQLGQMVLWAVLTGLSGAVAAAYLQRDAREWLISMSEAGQSRNYVGRFIYQHDDQVESLEIIHRGGPEGPQELLRALNGSTREIVRDRGMVRVYQPHSSGVLKRAPVHNFSGQLPMRVSRMASLYETRLGPQDRVAGRPTQVVEIIPKDSHRFGFRFWADKDSGLLLRSDLVNGDGRVLERCMFTSIALPEAIDKALFETAATTSLSAQAVEPEVKKAELISRWQVDWVPPGFALVEKVLREAEGGQLEQWVYSDGLVSVSVFIEKPEQSQAEFRGESRIGAMNAHGRMVGGFQVTVFGQTPLATLARIGDSVGPLHD